MKSALILKDSLEIWLSNASSVATQMYLSSDSLKSKRATTPALSLSAERPAWPIKKPPSFNGTQRNGSQSYSRKKSYHGSRKRPKRKSQGKIIPFSKWFGSKKPGKLTLDWSQEIFWENELSKDYDQFCWNIDLGGNTRASLKTYSLSNQKQTERSKRARRKTTWRSHSTI